MTTYTYVDDAPVRCPRCHKRLVEEAGQDEYTGALEVLWTCWSCTYTERAPWVRPRVRTRVPSESTAANRLAEMRLR